MPFVRVGWWRVVGSYDKIILVQFLIPSPLCCFGRSRQIAERAMVLVATLSILLINPKSLHLEHLAKIICSATFSVPTRWYLYQRCT